MSTPKRRKSVCDAECASVRAGQGGRGVSSEAHLLQDDGQDVLKPHPRPPLPTSSIPGAPLPVRWDSHVRNSGLEPRRDRLCGGQRPFKVAAHLGSDLSRGGMQSSIPEAGEARRQTVVRVRGRRRQIVLGRGFRLEGPVLYRGRLSRRRSQMCQ